MIDTTKRNTDTLGYLGDKFQGKLIFELLTDVKFCENIISFLHSKYFDDDSLKRILIEIKNYYEKYNKVPSIRNNSIVESVKARISDEIEQATILAILDKINENDKKRNSPNNHIQYDGDVIQKQIWMFIKQQEYKSLGQFIITNTINGNIEIVENIEERFKEITKIGIDDDMGVDIFSDIEDTLEPDYRNTIPTGLGQDIDDLMGGGLGNGEMGFILAGLGTGKAQPLTAKVLTPNGWKLMGDIEVGDEVISSNGKSTKVLGVFPQEGDREVYKVEFNDGSVTECDIDHLWSVNSLNMRNSSTRINGKYVRRPKYNYVVKSLKDIMNDGLYKKGQLNYRIPVVKPVEFSSVDVKIDPYILGCMIGDGYFERRSITTIDSEIIEYFKNNIECNIYDRTRNGNKVLYEISLLNFRKDLNYYYESDLKSSNKFIHKDYLYNSIENRIELLRGLLDTDGHIDNRGLIEYATKSKQLAEDVKELVKSLGGYASIKTKNSSYLKNNNRVDCGLIYRVNISMLDENLNPFKLKRKADRFKPRKKYANSKFIKNIEYKGKEKTQCIYVEDESHEYVTDDYIVTHNTTALTKIANHAHSLGKNVLQIFFEDNKKQIKRKHYAIWSGVPQSKLDDNAELVKDIIYSKKEQLKEGKLVLVKFAQDENITIPYIKRWIINYQKIYGFKFDMIVLDYIDCVESHEKNKNSDTLSNELIVTKAFEAMLADFNIPGWTATQGNRNSLGAEVVTTNQMGGSIKKAQKSHFLLSIARSDDQKERGLANLKILKSRFGRDGITFEDCIFDNDRLMINIRRNSNSFNNIIESELKDFRRNILED
jgi:hypothetical protein